MIPEPEGRAGIRWDTRAEPFELPIPSATTLHREAGTEPTHPAKAPSPRDITGTSLLEPRIAKAGERAPKSATNIGKAPRTLVGRCANVSYRAPGQAWKGGR